MEEKKWTGLSMDDAFRQDVIRYDETLQQLNNYGDIYESFIEYVYDEDMNIVAFRGREYEFGRIRYGADVDEKLYPFGTMRYRDLLEFARYGTWDGKKYD